MDTQGLNSFSSVYPWRTGNRFRLHVDGDQFYPAILKAMEEARYSIDVEMYLFESGKICDRFINVLIAARDRRVRVRLLLDYVGSGQLRSSDRSRMLKAGIELRFFNRIRQSKVLQNFSRDHRKIIVLDGTKVFCGGAGISDDFSQEILGSKAWHDMVMQMDGPVSVDWQALFETTWETYEFILDQEIRRRFREAFADAPLSKPVKNREVQQSRVVASSGWGSKPTIASLINEINKAEKRVWISTAYFYPPRRLVKAAVKAAGRGVDVRFLLPGHISDHPSVRYAGRTWYQKLLVNKIRIYEYQPRFLHMKVAVTDDWVSIGSFNFDRWNLRWNLEANQEIISPALVDTMCAEFEKDFGHSIEIRLPQWEKRSLLEKIREQFWRTLARILSRIPNQ